MCAVPQGQSKSTSLWSSPGSIGKMLEVTPLSVNPVLLSQRLFVVPTSPKQKEIPFARVNHNKYMVTDKIAYIGNATHATNKHTIHSFWTTNKGFFSFQVHLTGQVTTL